MNTTALFVDTFSRQVEVSTVSVSQVPEKGLVLRYGAKIGNLWQLTENSYGNYFRNYDFPVIVATRGYKAMSSGGFVDVLAIYTGDHTRVKTCVVGIQGMPFQRHKGLSVLSSPMEVLVLRPGTHIEMLETHARRKPYEGWHSNPQSADAAWEGIKMRASIRPNSVFVVEGQSDYTQCWELAALYEDYENPFQPKFQEEFRSERFSDEGLVCAALCRHARKMDDGPHTKDRVDGLVFMLAAMLVAGKQADSFLPPTVTRIVGADVVSHLYNQYKYDGWKLGVDLSLGNRFLQAVAPDGEIAARGYALFVVDDVECREALIEMLDALTEEERLIVKQKEGVILQG
jgi:hypothetical protein